MQSLVILPTVTLKLFAMSVCLLLALIGMFVALSWQDRLDRKFSTRKLSVEDYGQQEARITALFLITVILHCGSVLLLIYITIHLMMDALN